MIAHLKILSTKICTHHQAFATHIEKKDLWESFSLMRSKDFFNRDDIKPLLQ